MGFRIRKSINVGPIRINLSKRGIGYSVGGPGFRTGVGSDGRKRTTLSIPGTGISYQTSARSRATAPPQAPQPSASPTRSPAIPWQVILSIGVVILLLWLFFR